MAIILAGHSPKVRLLGVSTVAGNQTLDKVTRNALDVLHAAGLNHVDVVAGQSKPILRAAPILCPEIHGDSGLDVAHTSALRMPRSARVPLAGKAVNVMFERIRACYEAEGGARRVSLVCVGALTNVAVLLTLYPEVIPMVEVVIMGGSMGAGNTGPVVEFNIQTDPEAGRIVFECGVPLVMVPLEVTHTVLVTPAVLEALGGGTGGTSPLRAQVPRPAPMCHPHIEASSMMGATEGRVSSSSGGASASEAGEGDADPPTPPQGLRPAPMCHPHTGGTDGISATGLVDAEVDRGSAEALAAVNEAADVGGTVSGTDGAISPFRALVRGLLLFFSATYRDVFGFAHPPLHDPCAVAFCIAPELFKVREMRVDIEASSALSAGQTVCDIWGQSGRPHNCRVALRVDVDALWRLMTAAVDAADAVSPLNTAA